MHKFLLACALVLGLAIPAVAQVTIPNTLADGDTIAATPLNTNFTTLGSRALDRTNGNITGDITVDALKTIDGVDIGLQACVACTPTFGKVTLSNTSATSLTVGGGITAGTGAVALVDATGKIPDLSTTYFAAISASNFTTGTVPLARLPGLVTVTATQVGTYTAAIGEFVVANGTFTVNLPASASNSGKSIDVKNIGTGAITVDGNASETIDGATTFVLVTQYQSVTLISDGTNWYIR